jgi:hypothetical protein
MTPYNSEDLDGWEFKIVRSAKRRFNTTEAVRQVSDEEARSGWELLEKFDDFRLRFKRRTANRTNDRYAKIDPYRTHIGVTEGGLELIYVGISLLILGVICVAVYIYKGGF